MPELNKYLKHHGLLKQHQKSNKNDKVKTIMGHFLRMNTLRTGQANEYILSELDKPKWEAGINQVN